MTMTLYFAGCHQIAFIHFVLNVLNIFRASLTNFSICDVQFPPCLPVYLIPASILHSSLPDICLH